MLLQTESTVSVPQPSSQAVAKASPFVGQPHPKAKQNITAMKAILCPSLQLNVVPPATFPSSPHWPLLAWQAARVTGVPISSLLCHQQHNSHSSSRSALKQAHLFNTEKMSPTSGLTLLGETTGWSRLSQMLISTVLNLYITVRGGGNGRTHTETQTLPNPRGSPLLSFS